MKRMLYLKQRGIIGPTASKWMIYNQLDIEEFFRVLIKIHVIHITLFTIQYRLSIMQKYTKNKITQ
ncbi:hypothetical protein XSR1_320031 [Xenorhabdus szentirmaii DSM 16338]|uniref:Uncharacterized protein n=1 Tax=Xenorhabdus szentirmaii DSM 16338 TaxID=1427518 RepID=W1IYK4_9GAMM|nr:hypothetical protein XSR1_320031 [Xenorhabdus szentirmaii DSM 16338]